MLFRALADGARVLRAAGWRAPAVASLHFVFLPLVLLAPGWLAIGAAVVYTVDNIITFALVRVLAAHREVLPERPDPPVDPSVARPAPVLKPRVPPVSRADRAPGYALKASGRLVRPAMRLALVQILASFAGFLIFMMLSGGELLVADDDLSTADRLIRYAGVSLVIALAGAFILLAAQRIALESDERVLVAVAHSVRVARTRYGALLALVVAELLVELPGVASDDAAPVVAASYAAAVLLRLVVVAAALELYVGGPRLDVPDDFGRRPVRG